MLTVILIINALMALLCLLVAWQVWKLRRILGQVADTLISVERSTHAVLYGAPEAIYKGQKGVYQLRAQVRQLEPQLRRAQQVLGLLSLGGIVWQKRSMLSRAARHSR
jgi:hypothetical protein